MTMTQTLKVMQTMMNTMMMMMMMKTYMNMQKIMMKSIMKSLRMKKNMLVMHQAGQLTQRGNFSEEYFSPYIIPTIPHIPWAHGNAPIPPGIREEVIAILKKKIENGVLEGCQSAYRSHWFCVLKKDHKLRIVYDLQQLNSITVRDAGLPPILDSFVEPFAGSQCYTVLDMCSGFDARTLHPDSRDLTAI